VFGATCYVHVAEKKESISVFICNKSTSDEVLRRKAKNNFAKYKKKNRETTKKISF
jgi:hypothetical protein